MLPPSLLKPQPVCHLSYSLVNDWFLEIGGQRSMNVNFLTLQRGCVLFQRQVLNAAREAARLEARTGREELKRVRKETLRMRDELEAEAASHNELKVRASGATETRSCNSLLVQQQKCVVTSGTHTTVKGDHLKQHPDRC